MISLHLSMSHRHDEISSERKATQKLVLRIPDGSFWMSRSNTSNWYSDSYTTNKKQVALLTTINFIHENQMSWVSDGYITICSRDCLKYIAKMKRNISKNRSSSMFSSILSNASMFIGVSKYRERSEYTIFRGSTLSTVKIEIRIYLFLLIL